MGLYCSLALQYTSTSTSQYSNVYQIVKTQAGPKYSRFQAPAQRPVDRFQCCGVAGVRCCMNLVQYSEFDILYLVLHLVKRSTIDCGDHFPPCGIEDDMRRAQPVDESNLVLLL